MVDAINAVQELQLQLIEKASFNEFDGERVVKDLRDHKDLWRGAVMDRAGYSKPGARDFTPAIDLIKLRDIGSGYWNVDTLYILAEEGKDKDLELLAKDWGADEVDYLTEKESSDFLGTSARHRVLRVWWD